MIQLLAKPLVEKMKARLKADSQDFFEKTGRKPRLAVILVGDDPASVIYTSKKGQAALELGMEHETFQFPTNVSPSEVHLAVNRLNLDPAIDGILIQRPLPQTFKEEEVLYWVDAEKDVDAFHPINAGRLLLGLPCFAPCTPAGILMLLQHYGIDVSGKLACVIGRSSIVGKPMAVLLQQANATVIQCHSQTKNLAELTAQADLLVVAAGKPGLVTARHVKANAVVVDVGIHRTLEGKIVGDVAFDEVSAKASALTPVPGGVGPMTIMMLLANTLKAARNRALDRGSVQV